MTKQDLEKILRQVYQWSEKQNFRGYNKHDGLNSAILKLLLGWGKWPRILAIQSQRCALSATRQRQVLYVEPSQRRWTHTVW